MNFSIFEKDPWIAHELFQKINNPWINHEPFFRPFNQDENTWPHKSSFHCPRDESLKRQTKKFSNEGYLRYQSAFIVLILEIFLMQIFFYKSNIQVTFFLHELGQYVHLNNFFLSWQMQNIYNEFDNLNEISY